MMNADKASLLCDLAETYHIYNYKELPCKTVALFSCGLRENSRIKMKMNGQKIPVNEMLLASIVDRLSTLVWFGSEDGTKGINRPESILEALLGIEKESEREIVAFESGEDFEARWKAMILQKGE